MIISNKHIQRHYDSQRHIDIVDSIIKQVEIDHINIIISDINTTNTKKSKFMCKLCNAGTSKTYNRNRHLKSKSHIHKMNILIKLLYTGIVTITKCRKITISQSQLNVK